MKAQQASSLIIVVLLLLLGWSDVFADPVKMEMFGTVTEYPTNKSPIQIYEKNTFAIGSVQLILVPTSQGMTECIVYNQPKSGGIDCNWKGK